MKVTWSRTLDDDDARAYDAFVDGARGDLCAHYTQSRAWAELACVGKLLSPRWVLVRRERGGEVVGAAMVLVGSVGPLRLPFATLERGPVCSLDDMRDVLQALRRTALMHGAMRLEIMPYAAGDDVARVESTLASEGYRRDAALDGPHLCTLRIDLDAELLSAKDGKSLRQRVRQAEKLEVRAANEGEAGVEVLAAMHTRLMSEQGMHGKARAWYDALSKYVREHPSRGGIIVARKEGAPVSAAFVVRHGTLVTWLLGATSPEHTTAYSKMVPTVMEAMAWARAQGARTFDMGGVPGPQDTDDKRAKIAQFKYYFARATTMLVARHVRLF